MDKHIIKHTIPKSSEGLYYTIPFPVPAGLESITVSYSYERVSYASGAGGQQDAAVQHSKARRLVKMPNVVDLGLMDGRGRFLGWSGSARKTVSVGKNTSTSGYLMSDMEHGQWQIIVGAYKIPDAGLDVVYEIVYNAGRPCLLAGDLHIHTDASDGQYDAVSIAKRAKKAGLDFIGLANHNNCTDNLNPPVVPGVTVIPAVEWTHYRGHMNFFGVPAPFDNSFIANSEDEMRALVKQAAEKGALISVNHPKCTLCPYLWQSEDIFDLVEVWNGPMRRVNANAVAWWHGMQMAGHRVRLTGGSDYHRDMHPVRLGHPVVKVYTQSASAADILEAIRNGHSFVTASIKGVNLALSCDSDAMMGDAVQWRDGLTLAVQADGLRLGMSLKLVTNEGAVVWNNFSHGTLLATQTAPESWSFAYLVAYRSLFGREYIRAISNPVYFEHGNT